MATSDTPPHTLAAGAQPLSWRDKVAQDLVGNGLAILVLVAMVAVLVFIAACGPVGDCNTVQQSAYARLFGVVPMGVLGVVAYLVILTAWLTGRYAAGRPALLATLALFATTFGGTLFSVYLTFLEPFVIGATCAWCLASAVIITSLFWLSTPPFRHTLSAFR